MPDLFSICTSIFVGNGGNYFPLFKVLTEGGEEVGTWLQLGVEGGDSDMKEAEDVVHTLWKQFGKIGGMRFNRCTLAAAEMEKFVQ